jgi:hypothetical protein
MKTKVKGLLLIGSIVCLSVNRFTQYDENTTETKSKKNSIGFEHRFEGGISPNIGITYRRFFDDSKYNLRANFSIGSVESFSSQFAYPGFAGNALIYSTGDSSTPLIGVSETVYYNQSYQRLEIGLERNTKFWGLNFISGADFTLGHTRSARYGRITEVELQQIEQNGFIYNQYGAKDSDSTLPFEDLNYLNSTYNSLNAGLNLRAGVMVDISKRLYATAFIGIRASGQFLIKETFDYKNDLYKEHLPTRSSVDFFNFDTFASLGLNYRF